MEVPSILLLVLIISLVTTCSSKWNQTDRFALLAFKSQITNDPLGALSSWNDSLHHCEWKGIKCGGRHPDRVTFLELPSKKFEGTLSPYIGNLTFLMLIYLPGNNFHGEIPKEIGGLFRLQNFNLERNSFKGEIPQEIGRLSILKYLHLSNNTFSGEIPVNISHCSELREVDLSGNKLSGNIPRQLSSLSKLEFYGLGHNNFDGNIPSSFGNLSSLNVLYLAHNNLEGRIPDDLCHIQSLRYFAVSFNKLTGKVPSCLYNNSNMLNFGLTGNQLEGSVPPNIGLTLPNIQQFYFDLNKFSGSIPVSISNATSLDSFDFGANYFTGLVPTDLGRLESLRRVIVNSNRLGSRAGGDLEFITSLTNCSNLKLLSFDNNFLRGPLPDFVSNLTIKIQFLVANGNQIHGNIPLGIENLVNIEILDLSNNQLIGNIPSVIGKLNKLQEVDLSGNMLSGQIPVSLGNLTQLENLNLSSNNFSGNIPPRLGNCHNLEYLSLSHNNLVGTIPTQVIGISSLRLGLYLEHNSLTGSLPSQVGNLTNVVKFDVSGNKLSGRIPESLSDCLNLVELYMEGNSFEGKIPDTLHTLKGLQYFDLSLNNLTGEIPKYLARLPDLLYLNLSFNQLEGQVPSTGAFENASLVSVVGNKNLCGGIIELKLPPCKQIKKKMLFSMKVIIPVIVGGLCLFVLLCFLLIHNRRKMFKRNPSSTTLFNQSYKRLTYSELLKATNGFSAENLIGVGSYGSVFKGILMEINQIVAVKVLNLQREGAAKSFLTECNALRNLRHRNLLKVITSCSSVDFQGNDFKALVFEFMPTGSLEEWLHPKVDEHQFESRNLNLIQRLNIAIDVASALEYLHHHCEPVIVHCDLKPSNVLLDVDMTARVADFGIAKIFEAPSYDSAQSIVSSAAIKGSIGYVAPEYGMGGEVSTQGDVYAYGILLLEMFTGKKPTDDMFRDGLSLHSYSKVALRNQVMEIVDPIALVENNNEALIPVGWSDTRGRLNDCMVSLLRLGVTCSLESPLERMSMSEVVNELHHIRDHHQVAKANE